MQILFGFLVTILGVLAGGVLGRAAYALPRRELRGVIAPRCPSCGRELPMRYSAPLVGALSYRFRCPHCGEKQGARVLISELLLAAAWLALYLVYSFGYLFFLYAVVAAVLLLLSLIDLDLQEVPHPLLLILLVLGAMVFTFSFFDFSESGTVWWEHLVGAFAISLPLFILLMVTGGVGGGDVKLMFVLGFFLGYKLTLFAFLVGIVLAAITAIVLRLAFGKSGKFRLALVPFLSLGAVVSLLFGGALISLLF